jgi:lysophospholipase
MSTSTQNRWNIASLTCPDATKIRYGLYCQDTNHIDHFIIFINGHGEFIEKYNYLPEDLKLPTNYAFLTWDHRGQGASDGDPRLHIDDYEIIAKDAQHVINTLVGNKPYSVIAHSMGGLIALYATMRSYIKPTHLVLSAPLFGIQHAIPEFVGRALAKLATGIGLGRFYFQRKLQEETSFENNMFTHSQERFEKRYKSPYTIEGVTFGWIHSTFDAINFVKNESNLAKLKTPVSILYGDDERLVATKAIVEWVEKAQKICPTQISVKKLPQTRHEIFAEAPEAYARVLQLTRKCVLETEAD